MNYSDKRILIVENDLTSVYLVMEFLYQTEVKFIYVSDGSLVSDLCNSFAIDLVIIGNKLYGDINGIELTKVIKAKHPEIPVFAYSSDVDVDNIKEFYKAGCDFFIAKPADLNQLHRVFFTYLNRLKSSV